MYRYMFLYKTGNSTKFMCLNIIFLKRLRYITFYVIITYAQSCLCTLIEYESAKAITEKKISSSSGV